MGRHRTADEKRALGERASQLRAAGRSRREIQAELHIGDDLAKALLRGVPLPDRLARPRAKDKQRKDAVALRLAGKTYDQIAAELGVSKSSCSLWLRDLPYPPRDADYERRRIEGLRAASRRTQAKREDARQVVKREAADRLGVITTRDLLIALAVSYWCEGGKAKPWNPRECIRWMNSDPVLVRLFIEGLQELGVGAGRIRARVSIHESADVDGALFWWSEQSGISLERFRPTTLKRHNPRTVWKNTQADYHGCLTVDVQDSRLIYQRLDGLLHGLAGQPRYPGEWQDETEDPWPAA